MHILDGRFIILWSRMFSDYVEVKVNLHYPTQSCISQLFAVQ
jgi:hypothetical protein